jgi:MFS transporter, DHA1 family, multidrug resistance protein
VSLFIAVAVAMIGVGIIAPILPLYAKSFSANGVAIGLVFAAFSLSRSVLGPLVGRFSDRVGRKRILVVGLAGYAAISVLYAIAGSLWQLGLFRLLQGIASVMVTPIAQAYVGDITPPGREGRNMNLFYSSMFLGMALGPMLGGQLTALWSYHVAFYAMSALSVMALVLVGATVPSRPRDRDVPEPKAPTVPLSKVMRNDGVKAIAIYVATRGFWRQGFNTFYPIFAVAASGLSTASIGTILSVYMLGGGLLQIPFGYLADRYAKLPQIVLGSTLAPLLLLIVPFSHSVWTVAITMFVIGVLSALSRASVVAIRTQIGRTHGMGTLAGLQGGAFAAGQMLGPLVSGVIADTFGVAAVFPLGSAVGLIGSGVVFAWFRRWQRTASEVH